MGSYIPCDQKITSDVELSTMNQDLVKAAIEDMGGYVQTVGGRMYFQVPTYGQAWLEGSKLMLRENYGENRAKELGNKIKVGYAKQVVMASAKKFGWTATVDKKDEKKMTLKRRY
jgi:hypothetical protein